MNTNLDHLLALVLAVFWPAYEKFWDYPRWLRQLEQGVPGARLRGYRWAIAIQWGQVLLLLVGWAFAERPWSNLGLGWESSWRGILGLGVVAAALGYLEWQRQEIRRSPEAGAKVRQSMGTAEPLLPHTRGELSGFHAVAVTAGVCEEILYRGFLIAYLAAMMPLWAAALVSSVIFGVAHSYLGPLPALRAGLVGAVAAGLYLLTGSLWAPILLHAGIDLNAGLTGFDVLRDRSATPEGVEPATPA